jgi:hypothetical protein
MRGSFCQEAQIIGDKSAVSATFLDGLWKKCFDFIEGNQ